MKTRFYYNPIVREEFVGIPGMPKHYGVQFYMDIAKHGILLMTLIDKDPVHLLERINAKVKLFNETHKRATFHDLKLLITDIFKKK